MGCGEYILCDGVLQNIVGWTCCSCFLERMNQFGRTIPHDRHSPGVLKNSLWLLEEHRCVLLLLILPKVYYRDQFAAKPYERATLRRVNALLLLLLTIK